MQEEENMAPKLSLDDEVKKMMALYCVGGRKSLKEAIDLSKTKTMAVAHTFTTTRYQELMKNLENRRAEYDAITNSEDSKLVCFIRYNLDGRDICSILSSPNIDYLLRTDNPSNKVQVSRLIGKKVGLYFSFPWYLECRKFARILADVYNDLSGKGDFEIVVITTGVKSFHGIFSKMPWLAVPFSDSEAFKHLERLFLVHSRPVLVILDENGHVLTNSGAEIIRDYGAEGYPFTRERLKEVKEEGEAAKENQSLQSILVSKTRDFVISNDGKEVKIRELEGKFVGIYFSDRSSNFTAKLIKLYNKLKTDGESFEIVMIPIEYEEEHSGQEFEVPWLSLPFKDTSRWRLNRYFEVTAIPTLVVIGPDGKTVHLNAVDAVEEYGALAYPFTAEKFSELKRIEKEKHEAQTLESLFVSGDLDFLIRRDGTQVPVSSFARKHVLLYFSGRSCGYSTKKLVRIYKSIKREDDAFKMICIFHSTDKRSFDRRFSKMPSCLALPFGDKRKQSICCTFKNSLVAFGPTGKFITAETLEFLNMYGPEAYPFTEKRIEEIEEKYAEVLKEFPNKLDVSFHLHELVCSPAWDYECNICRSKGKGCSFICEECDYFLHPECALICKKAEDEDESRMLATGGL